MTDRCGFCGEPAVNEYLWPCPSCSEDFHEDCWRVHFEAGEHVALVAGQPTIWVAGRVKLMGPYTYQDDGTGRNIWIPAIEPHEWGMA